MFDIYFADCLGRENNCLYPHKATITDAESLAQAVSHDYVCARYKNNYRNNTNFEPTSKRAIASPGNSITTIPRIRKTGLSRRSWRRNFRMCRLVSITAGTICCRRVIKAPDPGSTLS